MNVDEECVREEEEDDGDFEDGEDLLEHGEEGEEMDEGEQWDEVMRDQHSEMGVGAGAASETTTTRSTHSHENGGAEHTGVLARISLNSDKAGMSGVDKQRTDAIILQASKVV